MTLDAPQKTAAQAGRFERLFSFAAQDARQLDLEPGATVHEPATAAESVYYVHSGQVRIYQVGPDGESLRLTDILGPDDWFGAASLAQARTYGTRAVAVTRTVVSECPPTAGPPRLTPHPTWRQK